ncbi:MAG: orotate phosphoribosyltransferase [Flavobacteriaceae bacterium]|nr:orotate phosphoribosyltransferase [Flavobacteriaceae bacterium]MCY4267351.1 orotate phosphoribosyltransferase [Flavobacteriaceae bacterium]MCY4299458.1 orotate phosphoribosyltransferase [Flavobacteriaceae bacterium]
MIWDQKIARQVAKLLLQINAIQLNLKKPFVWTSGIKSPIYCNNRLILSYPHIRHQVTLWLAEAIQKKYQNQSFHIAGVATGAIGMATLVAHRLNKPYFNLQAEKTFQSKTNTKTHLVVIEDLVSTGKSSLGAIKGIDSVSYSVNDMYCLFTYGFEIMVRKFQEQNIKLHSLCDYEHLIAYAQEINKINQSELNKLAAWRKNPTTWC